MLGLAGSNCNAEGRYFTSDFVGVLREDLGRATAARWCSSTARSAC